MTRTTHGRTGRHCVSTIDMTAVDDTATIDTGQTMRAGILDDRVDRGCSANS